MSRQRENPNVLVYGAGAVGCLLGGLLASADCRVTLLGRAATGDRIRERGLQVTLHDRQFAVRPRFFTSTDDIEGSPDLIILATRACAVQTAIPDLRRLAGEHTTLLTVQNGVGTEELIARELPGIHHVAGSLTLSAGMNEAAHVETTSRSGGIALAPVSRHADVPRIAALFSAAGIHTEISDDYRSMKWSKLLLNMMGNAVPAILGWTPGAVYRNPDLYRIERAAVREAIRVVREEGLRLVSLPGFPVQVLPWLFRAPDAVTRRLLLSRVEGGRGDKMPSMLLDLEAGRDRTEARWLYGAVVAAGSRLGIPAPVNSRLLRVMEAVTSNRDLREAFRNRPPLLARNVMLGAEAGEHAFVHRWCE